MTSDVCDLGSVRAGDTVRREVLVHNPDSVALTIKQACAACSTLRVAGLSRTIPPGGDGVIAVEFSPVRSGRAEIDLLVDTGRPKDSLLTYHCSGEVSPELTANQPESDPGNDTVFLAGSSLAKLLEDKSLMIFDIRSQARYNSIHVQGSVNAPLWSLKGMQALKDKRVVLLGSGIDDTLLVREALELRQLGFRSIQVLPGGIRNWVLAGLPVSGADRDATQSAMVDPLDFLSSPQDGWLILELSSEPSAKPQIPGSIRVSLGDDFSKRMTEEIHKASRSHAPPSKVLYVSPQGEGYETVEKNLPKPQLLPVFYLGGGGRAYYTAVDQWKSSLHRGQYALAGQSSASSTTAGGVVVRNDAGCTSCPGQKGKR